MYVETEDRGESDKLLKISEKMDKHLFLGFPLL